VLGKLRQRTSEIDVRRCVACGYAGRFAIATSDGTCPSCGCDFRARPPRTYAEMEGIVPVVSRREARQRLRDSENRLVERWIAVLFAGAVLFVAAASLAATVLAAL